MASLHTSKAYSSHTSIHPNACLPHFLFTYFPLYVLSRLPKWQTTAAAFLPALCVWRGVDNTFPLPFPCMDRDGFISCSAFCVWFLFARILRQAAGDTAKHGIEQAALCGCCWYCPRFGSDDRILGKEGKTCIATLAFPAHFFHDIVPLPRACWRYAATPAPLTLPPVI